MKNTVYALARTRPVRRARELRLTPGRALSRAQSEAAIASASTSSSMRWGRIRVGGRGTGSRSCARVPKTRTAQRQTDRHGAAFTRGHRRLVDPEVRRTRRSTAFPRRVHDAAGDHGSVVRDLADRDVALRDDRHRFGPLWRAVRQRCSSPSPSTTAARCSTRSTPWAQAVLESVDDVGGDHLVMPNKHHLPVDLSRFGLENRNEVFVATDEPHGLIEAT